MALLAIMQALRSTRADPVVWRLGGTSEIEEDFGALGVPVMGGAGAAWKAPLQPLSLFRYVRRESVALIQTFLFITMDGTPEGAEFWRRLRLSGADRAYLGLDDLRTYAESDLKSDPELVRILSDCGCGHLFDVAKGACPEQPGYARLLRSYLGLDQKRSFGWTGNPQG